ncbi:MAG: peptidase M50 [Phycisphaerae bacterium]|nr:MAG: peptidase M50 [Phycisphaerae bacterium]
MEMWWLTREWEKGPAALFTWVFWALFSVTLHELGHGWAAIREGDRTPVLSGHMTWNPLVHIGRMGAFMFLIIGLPFGAMPVTPSNFQRRYSDTFVAFAGPAMNFTLTIVCTLALTLWLNPRLGVTDPIHGHVTHFFWWGAVLNLVLGVFNLIPIPPMDGYRIVADLQPRYARLWQTEAAAVVGMILFVILFLRAGSVLFSFAAETIITVVKALARALYA